LKIRVLILFISCISLQSFCQNESWGDYVKIDFPKLDQLSLDNQGFIFLADLEGNIYQYDRNGKFINNFSPARQGSLSQLEAFWTVNIFTFSTDLQEYRILNRFIIPIAENRFPMDLVGLAKMATLGNNNIIWIYDETDLSLKQFDYIRGRIIQNQPLNLILDRSSLDIIDIKEYQNLLFLNIRNEGVFILDNQGNFIKRIEMASDQKLGFWKSNLVYLKDKKIILVNFQSDETKEIEVPIGIEPKAFRINRNNVLFFDSNQVWMYDKSETPLDKF
jgi:hypothetical protein